MKHLSPSQESNIYFQVSDNRMKLLVVSVCYRAIQINYSPHLREEKVIKQSHSVNFTNELNAAARSEMLFHCSNIVISVLPI